MIYLDGELVQCPIINEKILVIKLGLVKLLSMIIILI